MTVPSFTRRAFHSTLLGGLALSVASARRANAAPSEAPPESDDAAVAEVPERDYPAPGFTPRFKKPQIKPILIQDFVVFAHYDLPMVKRLLEKEPMLLHTTVDWGGGDWESALGAAAHTGRREIAEFLLSQGARIDIFCAAMLGHLDVVKSLLTSHPQLINARGPHGFTLISHAKAGKVPARPVLEFLEEFKTKFESTTPSPTKAGS